MNLTSETYPLPRFITETVIITVSVTLNIVGFCLVLSMHRRPTMRSVYHILYLNLAVSNLLACLLTWLCNNWTFLFQQRHDETLANVTWRCRARGLELLGLYVALAVGVQMTLAMLCPVVVQFCNICHSTCTDYTQQRNRAVMYMIASAVITSSCIAFPVGVMLVRTRRCDGDVIIDIAKDAVTGANTLTAVITLLYVIMTILAISIFKNTRKFYRQSEQALNGSTLKEARRAFRTTMMLFISLTLFFIPFTIYFVYCLNKEGVKNAHGNKAIFYLTMMPCAKCIFDPIIYLVRIRHIWKQLEITFTWCFQLKSPPDSNETNEISSSGLEIPESVSNISMQTQA